MNEGDIHVDRKGELSVSSGVENRHSLRFLIACLEGSHSAIKWYST